MHDMNLLNTTVVRAANGILELGSRVRIGSKGNPAGAVGTVRALQPSHVDRFSAASVHLDGTPNNRFVRQLALFLFLLSPYELHQAALAAWHRLARGPRPSG